MAEAGAGAPMMLTAAAPKSVELLRCRSDSDESKRNHALLVGAGSGFGRVDLDAALEVRAVLDADARRGNVADDRAIFLNIDAGARLNMAHDFAVDDRFARVDFGMQLGGRAYGQFMTAQRNWAIHFPVNLQVFGGR